MQRKRKRVIKSTEKEIHLVESIASKTNLPGHFKAGSSVKESGIYIAYHEQHRTPHEVTLIEGYKFPLCSRCGDKVEFSLDQSAPHLSDKTSPIIHTLGPYDAKIA